jgi:hypothetical protein
MSRVQGVPSIRLRAHRAAAGATLLMLTLGACGGADDGNDRMRAGPDDSGTPTAAVATTAASRDVDLDFGGTRYPLRLVRCDLTGTHYDGMLVHGSGTAPDGRGISLQVERVEEGDRVSEGVFVSFGSLMDGDVWSASRHRLPDGRWVADEAAMESADGPMIEISGDEIVVEAELMHETDATTRPSTVRATCSE